MKLILLDIDGVLNHHDAYKAGFCKYTNLDDGSHYQTFDPTSKALLNKLIEEFDAKIVISSTWRVDGIEKLKKVWINEQMSGEIIGLTPRLQTRTKDKTYNVPRGFEVQVYLEDLGFHHINWSEDEQQKYCKKSGVEQYIIIDDDSDMLYNQRNNFVHVLSDTNNKSGFNQFYYEQARQILGTTIIRQKYGE